MSNSAWGKSLSRVVLFSFIIIASVTLHGTAAFAAPGDITAVRILGNTQHNGWVAEIDVDTLGTTGTYNFGLGANNAVSTSTKVVLTVQSPGFDAQGQPTTITRTIYGTKWVRKAYPNNTQADEYQTGTTTTLRIALSDYIYAGDSSVTATILPGLYKVGTTTTQGAQLPVQNNSTLTYPKVIGRFAWPGYERVTSDFLVEATAVNQFAQYGKPVAAVVFTATDQHGKSVSQTVSEMTKSIRTGDANVVPVYAATIPVAGLTSGDTITVNFRAYPWVGDSAAVLNSEVGADGVSQPSEKLGPITEVLDTAGTYGVGYALVSPFGKISTSTGARVYASQAAAEAAGTSTAFTTIGRAAEAIQAYQKTSFGRNTADGGVILLAEGSYTFPGYTPKDLGKMKTWLTVQPASTAARARTLITAGTNAVFPAERLKIEGLSLVSSTSPATFKGRSTTDVLWLHNNVINLPTKGAVVSYAASFATQNTIPAFATGFVNFGSNKNGYQLIRGNSAGTPIPGQFYTILGNKNILPRYIELGNAAGESAGENIIYAFNTVYGASTANDIDVHTPTSKGIAILGNVIESLSTVNPLLQVAAGNSSAPTTNVIIWNNSFAGERQNIGYNDLGTAAPLRTNFSKRLNIFKMDSVKSDTFAGGPASPMRTGNWAVVYNVGAIGNFSKYMISPGSFEGLSTIWATKSTLVNPRYTNDKSSDGAGGGYGDYTLSSASPAINILTSSAAQTLPFDLLGNPIVGTPDAGAYEYQGVLTTPNAVVQQPLSSTLQSDDSTTL